MRNLRKHTRSETIYSTPAQGTLALAVILITIAILAAGEHREEAIKARRTFIWTNTLASPAENGGEKQIYQVGRGQ